MEHLLLSFSSAASGTATGSADGTRGGRVRGAGFSVSGSNVSGEATGAVSGRSVLMPTICREKEGNVKTTFIFIFVTIKNSVCWLAVKVTDLLVIYLLQLPRWSTGRKRDC